MLDVLQKPLLGQPGFPGAGTSHPSWGYSHSQALSDLSSLQSPHKGAEDRASSSGKAPQTACTSMHFLENAAQCSPAGCVGPDTPARDTQGSGPHAPGLNSAGLLHFRHPRTLHRVCTPPRPCHFLKERGSIQSCSWSQTSTPNSRTNECLQSLEAKREQVSRDATSHTAVINRTVTPALLSHATVQFESWARAWRLKKHTRDIGHP